jgi:hypothetical protein
MLRAGFERSRLAQVPVAFAGELPPAFVVGRPAG